ncbi:hypothetical protein [Nocardia sp. alder85J]|uniref:hypothetical protein n=1 Tax=Nocardia sp. alder85J TaxID=2862949 RepID=UPI001CD4D2D1|nr:hypothetical protein [Nocardia sp. alder85J]MCX4091022.1 hypothetical protein [Nocardia sp. alder85J]
MRKFTAGAALIVGAVSIAAGTGHAEPLQAPQPVSEHRTAELNGVHFTFDRDGGSLVVTAPDGAFQTVGDSVVVTDTRGRFNDSLPLTYRKDDQVFPIAAEIGAHSVRLTPSSTDGRPVVDPITPADIARGHDVSRAQDVAESFTPRDSSALGLFASRAGVASVAGAAIGALVGLTVGCVAGGVVGSVSTAITTLLAGVVPGALVGCVAGAATIGSLGSLAGTALVTGPVVLWSAYQYFTTVTAPCTGAGAYCVDPAQPAPAK